MKTKDYTPKQAALIIGVSVRRVQAMLKQDQNPNRQKTHFPHAYLCPCGQGWLIPAKDINHK